MKKSAARAGPVIPANLSELKTAPYNFRTMEERSKIGLGFSMEEFGDIAGIVFNLRTGHLVTGHRRVEQLGKALIKNWRPTSDSSGTVGYAEVSVDGRTWNIRFVDWEEKKERAANVAANNREIAGTYSGEFIPVLEDIKLETPEFYDGALLFSVDDELKALRERAGRDGEQIEDGLPEYDLSPIPYETYNYVMLIFKNEIDWVSAIDHFDLKKVSDPVRPHKIGIGVVLDGAKYLNQRLEHLWKKSRS
jgi:hypothetical protein